MIYTLWAKMECLHMNVKTLLPSFYLKNYHSFVLFNSIIFFLMALPFPEQNDWSLNGMRGFLEFPVMFLLVALAVFNFCLYSRSFIAKSYSSIQHTISDSFTVYSVYGVILLKIMFHVLCLPFYVNDPNALKILSQDWMLGTMCLFYFMYIIAIGHFIILSFKGTYLRYMYPAKTTHWIMDYLNPKQLRKIKNVSANGQIVSVYFKGFLLDETDNSVVVRKHKLKLNAFRDYITMNNFKVDELSDEELTVIEMLGI